ncbi:MAG: SDR family NAD(P)-dependent oxidoreductase [Rhodobacterales bacterium]|nr:SDR family NAD(P)-dependent oxidoreductase [Rhodobacterales bacterium]
MTGAGRGLGLCLTRHLSAEGARVFALSRQPGEDLPGVTPIPYDQSDEASIRAAARAVDRPVDVVIHNAAIRGDTEGLASLTADHLAEVMRINVAGPLLLTQALLPVLSPNAVLAFISSRAGSFTEGHDPDGDYAYCLSKAALNRAVAKLADDLPHTMLALHPGWIATDMGGPDAPGTPETAALQIIALVSGTDCPPSGSFTDSRGRPIAP